MLCILLSSPSRGRARFLEAVLYCFGFNQKLREIAVIPHVEPFLKTFQVILCFAVLGWLLQEQVREHMKHFQSYTFELRVRVEVLEPFC